MRRARKFEIGQTWVSILIDGQQQHKGYLVKLLYCEDCWDNSGKRWLGRNLDAEPKPYSPHVVWFDDSGRELFANEQKFSDGYFQLTRKSRAKRTPA